jgi:YHS domain-containing protein
MHEPEHITVTQKQFIADNFGSTELGLVRIAKNLGLQAMSDSDVVCHCHKIILSTSTQDVKMRGKNYYFNSQEYSAVLTINKSSLGIITAKPFG